MSDPFWRSGPYVGLLADRYVQGTPLARGHVALSVPALSQALKSIAAGSSRTKQLVQHLADDELAALPRVAAALETCGELCKQIFSAQTPEKTAPVAGDISQSIKTLPIGKYLLVPAGWVSLTSAGTLLYIITRDTDTSFSLTACNGGSGLRYHPSKAFPDKIKHRTCVKIKDVPLSRVSDVGFWTVSLLLFTKDPPSEFSRAEVIYDVLLPWLAEISTKHAKPVDLESQLSSVFSKMSVIDAPPAPSGGGSAPAAKPDLGSLLMASLSNLPPAPSASSSAPAAQPPQPSADLSACLLQALQQPASAQTGATGSIDQPLLHPRLLAEAWRETVDDPHGKWRTPSCASAHWKSAWEAARYLLSVEGVSESGLKLVSLALRREFVVRAASDLLHCLPADHPYVTELVDRHDAPFTSHSLTKLTTAITDNRNHRERALRTPDGDEKQCSAVIHGGITVVALYIGASWCEPCKAFTPFLKQLYETTLKPRGVEVIFVSGDKTEEDFLAYHEQMPWPAAPFRIGREAAQGYNIDSIPKVLLFDAKTGVLISSDGVKALTAHGEACPWSDDRSVLRPRLTDDDARLLNMGTEMYARKALKEWQNGKLTESCLQGVHALTETVLRSAESGKKTDPELASDKAKSRDVTNVAIEPVSLTGDVFDKKIFEREDGSNVLKIGTACEGNTGLAYHGFEHLSKKDTKEYEGRRQRAEDPEVIDILSLPERVATAGEALAALRTTKALCAQLMSKAAQAATTSRVVLHVECVSLISFVFLNVIPVPSHPKNPSGKRLSGSLSSASESSPSATCIWADSAGLPSATEQKECLELLHDLLTTFVSASQSIECPTRGSDGERLLVVSCLKCVFDRVLRRVYGDSDTLLLSSLLGEGSGTRISWKLCPDSRSFANVAQMMEVEDPRFVSVLHELLEYVAADENGYENEIFDWAMPDKIEVKKYSATGLFVRKIVERAGLPFFPEDDPNVPSEMEALVNWLTADDTALARDHREFILARNVSALYRFAATMEGRDTELLRRRKDNTAHYWSLSFEEAQGKRGIAGWMIRRGEKLAWDTAGVRGQDLDIADLVVTGFGRELRWGEGSVVCSPIDLEAVLQSNALTEDDIIHTGTLPDYAGTLSREESEHLFSVLTVRYLSIPLVLDFFATSDRHTYLFNPFLQNVLRATIFEPGPWRSAHAIPPQTTHVPLRLNQHQKSKKELRAFYDAKYSEPGEETLSTPLGLLVNELRRSPGAVLDPLVKISEASLKDLSRCSVYSTNAQYLSFLFHLLLDVQGFVVSVTSDPRHTARISKILVENFRPMLLSWKAEAKARPDLETCAVVYSFLALIDQNVDDLDSCVDCLTACAFVRNWHSFGLGRLRSDIVTQFEGEDGAQLTAESRLLRFLQAQGIDTSHVAPQALEKYVSGSHRCRPLFLHVGRETIRVPTLAVTTGETEGEAQAVKLPPHDLLEIKLFRAMCVHRRRWVLSVRGESDSSRRNTLLDSIVRTALNTPEFSSPDDWEQKVDRYLSTKADLLVDLQRGEVLWRNDGLRPIPDSMMQFTEYETIFGRDAMQCGLVKRTAHQHWVHVVGTEYDLVEWSEPSPTELGNGFPVQKSAGSGDEELARKLQEEDDAAQGSPPLWAGFPGATGQNKRRRRDDEPFISMEKGVEYAGKLYNRAIDPYTTDPHPVQHELWAVNILKDTVATIYPKHKPLSFQFYLPDAHLSANATTAVFLACDGETEPTLTFKEAIIHKDTQIMQVWMLVSHGRRLWKSLIFSSNARFCLHNLTVDPKKAFEPPFLRHAAGNMKQKRVHGPSLVINRRSKTLGGSETYLPPHLLQGLIPSGFLENFNFWLGADDMLRGESFQSTPSPWYDYCVEVDLSVTDGTAVVCRRPKTQGFRPITAKNLDSHDAFVRADTHHSDDASTLKISAAAVSAELVNTVHELGLGYSEVVVRHALVKNELSLDRTVQWLMDDANVGELLRIIDLEPAAGGDSVMTPADPQPEQDMEMTDTQQSADAEDGATSGFTDEILLPLHEATKDDAFLSSFSEHVTCLDDLSHVYAWCTACATPAGGKHFDPNSGVAGGSAKAQESGFTYRLTTIDLPRLNLKLVPGVDRNGARQLFVSDLPGWHVCLSDPRDQHRALAHSFSEGLFLKNASDEYQYLVPNHDLCRPSIDGIAFPVRTRPLRSSLGWEELMSQRYFLYPVHSSDSFLICTGLGPTLYLTLSQVLTRNYVETFRLLDGVFTDTEFQPDEKWIFAQFKHTLDDGSPDAVACRLKLTVSVHFGPTKCPWEVHEEADRYLTLERHISNACALSDTEIELALRKCRQGSPLVRNRLRLIAASTSDGNRGSTGASKNEVLQALEPVVPGQPWLKLLMLSSQHIDTHCERLQKVQYTRPRLDTEEKCAEFLWSDAFIQDELSGGSKRLGVLFLHDLFHGGVSVRVSGKDVSKTIQTLLARWTHLKLSKWGRESVESGEVHVPLSRNLVQLAHVCRYPTRLWPSFANEATLREAAIGMDLYKAEGRHSSIRQFFDSVDRVFAQSLSSHRAPGNGFDHLKRQLDDHQRKPLNAGLPFAKETAAEWLATPVFPSVPAPRKRFAAANASCGARAVPDGAEGGRFEHPLRTVEDKFVAWVDATGPDDVLHEKLPFDIPAASKATPVARAMIERLEEDVFRYANTMRHAKRPLITHLTIGGTPTAPQGANTELATALRTLESLIQELETVRKADEAEVAELSRNILQTANRINRGTPSQFTQRLAYALARHARVTPAPLDVPQACSVFLSSSIEDDLTAANPFSGYAQPVQAQAAVKPTKPRNSKERSLCADLAPVLAKCNRMQHAAVARTASENLRDLLLSGGVKAEEAAQGAPPASPSSPASAVGGMSHGFVSDRISKITHAAASLAEMLTQKRHYITSATATSPTARQFDPRFLVFEFLFGIRLRKRQVEMIDWFSMNLAAGNSRVRQMIMGQGKTHVVSPLLVLLLANGTRLVTQVVPSALLEQSKNVLRNCFAAPVLPKKVFTLQFDRSIEDSPEPILSLLSKLRTATEASGVVVAQPESIKSLELKFIELLHSLQTASMQVFAMASSSSFGDNEFASQAKERLRLRSEMADSLAKVLRVWKTGTLLLDEVDVLLHPLRSELNFPIGNKHALDLAGLRWDLPMFLIDAFFVSHSPVLHHMVTEVHDASWQRAFHRANTSPEALLAATKEAISLGFKRNALQQSPHLVLLDTEFYQSELKRVFAQWAVVWLLRHLSDVPAAGGVQEGLLSFLTAEENAESGSARAREVVASQLVRGGPIDEKLLVLARTWLCSLLPHVLGKVNRVGYGLLQEADKVFVDPSGSRSRLLSAVPFVGKDVPSKSSEFAQPDVVIGLTILAFRYEGMRKDDVQAVIRQLKREYTQQLGPRDQRPACVLFQTWVREGADASKESVLPLPLFHLKDPKQFNRLFALVRGNPGLVTYYLTRHVFPTTMNFQKLKISACGHELGSSLLFGGRAGFSGTPSNLMPLDLGSCEYEPGSDGEIVHTLTSNQVVRAQLKENWNAQSLLKDIAQSNPPFHALIDTGACITNMENAEVAAFLLGYLPPAFEGVVYLDKRDNKMFYPRSAKPVPLAQCGVGESRRFTFYDQIHTTGMDIKQAPTAAAVLTIGKDMTFRDFAQGAYRMRGIGRGQTITLYIIAEVYHRMQADLGAHAAGQEALDVPSWLLQNSARKESLQAVKLGQQEVQNVWRKHALRALTADAEENGQKDVSIRVRRFEQNAWLSRCVEEYREIVGHDIEVASTSEFEGGDSAGRLAKMKEEHATFPMMEQDLQRVADVLKGIKETVRKEATQMAYEASVVHEQEAEEEKQKEVEQEAQKVSAFSRDDEQHNPWPVAVLSCPAAEHREKPEIAQKFSPFYPLADLQCTEQQPKIGFPEHVLVTQNLFRPTWLGMGERRLKVCHAVLVWAPRGTDESGPVKEEEFGTSLVTLTEAETLRQVIHAAGGNEKLRKFTRVLCLLTPQGAVIDLLCDAALPDWQRLAQPATASSGTAAQLPSFVAKTLLCTRFFNGETHYTEEELLDLERVLASAALPARRAFFEEMMRLRQRQKASVFDAPVERLFEKEEDLENVRNKVLAEKVGAVIRRKMGKGLDVHGVFLQCAGGAERADAQQMAHAIKLLAGDEIGSPKDVQTLVAWLAIESWSFPQFLDAFAVDLDRDYKPAAAHASLAAPQKQDGFWACSSCTYVNAPGEEACAMCGYGWSGAKECPRDKWVCAPEAGGCSFFNPKTMFYCEVCNRARPDLATVPF